MARKSRERAPKKAPKKKTLKKKTPKTRRKKTPKRTLKKKVYAARPPPLLYGSDSDVEIIED
jgi:hypothetical protein